MIRQSTAEPASRRTLRPTTTSPQRRDAQAAASRHVVAGWRRFALMGLAAVFFGLGLLGVALPGLPATPFLLLTSYFLVRSSPRLNERLLRSRVFGPILVDWQVHGGVRTHVRTKAIAAVVILVGVTIAVAGYSRSVSIAVAALAITGIVVILKLPSADR